MTEPPPTAKKASAPYGFAKAIASFILSNCQLGSESSPFDSRVILGFYSNLVIDRKPDSLLRELLYYYLHRAQLRYRRICDNTHFLRAHVFEVHPHFPCASWTEPYTRCTQLESIFLLL